MCQSPAKVSAVYESDGIPFLGVVGSGEKPEPLGGYNGKAVPFHIDTADITVIPTIVWLQLDGAELRPSQRTLRGPSQEPWPVIGHLKESSFYSHTKMCM